MGVLLKTTTHKTLLGNYDAKAGTGGPESLQILKPVAICVLLHEPCQGKVREFESETFQEEKKVTGFQRGRSEI